MRRLDGLRRSCTLGCAVQAVVCLLLLASATPGASQQIAAGEREAQARGLHELGSALADRGEYQQALREHERAWQLRSAGPDASLIAESREHLAHVLIRLERLNDAEAHLSAALAIRESEPLSPRLIRTLELLATVERYRGNLASARSIVDRAVTLQRKIDPDAGASLLLLSGDIHYLSGAIPTAREVYAAAQALAKRTLPADHPSYSQYLRKQGLAAWSLGDSAEARELRESAFETACAPSHPAIPIGPG